MTIFVSVANLAMGVVAVVISVASGLADGDLRAASVGTLSVIAWAAFAARPARVERWAETHQRRCAVALLAWAIVVIVVGPSNANPGYLLVVWLVVACGVVVPNRGALSYGVVVGLVYVAWALSSSWTALDRAGDTSRIPINAAGIVVAAAVGAMLVQARGHLRVLALQLELELAQDRQRNAVQTRTHEAEGRLVAFLETTNATLRDEDPLAADVVREVIDTRNGLVGEIVEAANRLRRPPHGPRDAIQRLADNRRALSRFRLTTDVEIASGVPDDLDPLIQALVLEAAYGTWRRPSARASPRPYAALDALAGYLHRRLSPIEVRLELGSLEERTARGWTAYALSRDVHHRGSRVFPVLEAVLDAQQLAELGELNDELNR
ncbi:MAG: hypothetical protein ACLP0J_26110 [Solirubrobacteraceae bacterium]